MGIQKDDTIKVSATLAHFADNRPEFMLDGDVDTVYASNGTYDNGSYADIYFKFDRHHVIDNLQFYTSNLRGWGLVQRYEILYRNNISTEDWISVSEKTDTNNSVGWRTSDFTPVYTNEICLRIWGSNGRFVTINEVKMQKNLKFLMDIMTLFDETNEEFILSDFLNLPLIDEIYQDLESYKELIKVVSVAKFCYLSKIEKIRSKETTLIKPIAKTNEFCKSLKINETRLLESLEMSVESSRNILLLANVDCEIVIIKDSDTFENSKVIEIKKGFNRVFIPTSGELFLLGDRDQEVVIRAYGVSNSNVFKMGDSTFKNYFQTENNKENMIIESKNFILNLKKEWIKSNCDEYSFVDSILTLEAFYDYIYTNLDMPLLYERSPLKRIILQGVSDSSIERKDGEFGSYLTFGGNPNLFFNSGIYNLANLDLFRLASDEIVGDKYFPEELANSLKLLFSKTFELKYTKILTFTGDTKKDILLRVLLYSNSQRFITRIFRNYYYYELSEGENPIDKLVLWMSELLTRNIAKLFSSNGYNISEEVLNECNNYPDIFLDINDITSENYLEFVREEKRVFNQQYLTSI